MASAEAGEPDPGGGILTLGPQGWAVTGAAFQTPLVWARGTAPSPLGSGHWIYPLLAPPGPLPAFAPRVPMGTCSVPGWARGVPTGSLSGNEAFCTVGLLDADLRRESPSISETLWVCAPWPSCRTRDEAVQTNQPQAHRCGHWAGEAGPRRPGLASLSRRSPGSEQGSKLEPEEEV